MCAAATGFEDAQSQAAAAEIHRLGGAVLAEELYPYLAQPPPVRPDDGNYAADLAVNKLRWLT